MADENVPNEALRNSKAEGERWDSGVERHHLDEAVNRNTENTTPRRYEQPVEDDEDPVMPGDGSTLNTKI